jgi:hypothetical protein
VWGGLLLIGAVALMAAVVWALRRRIFRDSAPAEPGWSLQHLREMQRDGSITGEEFERLRQRLLDAAARGRGETRNIDTRGIEIKRPPEGRR